MASLNLQKITQSNYDIIKANSEVDSSTIYFISDKGTIYVRDKKYGGNVIVLNEDKDPEYPELNTIYVYPSLQAKVYNGTSFSLINKGFIINMDDESTDSFVPTAKAVASYVQTKLNEISESGLGVTDIKTKTGTNVGIGLTVTKNATDSDLMLTGAVYNPTYDESTRTLNLPITNGETLSINFAKDNVVTAGKFNEDTKEIWLTTAEDKSFDDENEIIKIPATALVDIYTGKITNTTTTTVSATNEISVDVKISAKENNSLTAEEDGLFVNVPSDENKLNKVATSHINEVIIANADGTIKVSGTTLGNETLSSTPNVNTLATETAVKNYADTVAANAKGEAITEATSLASTAETNAKKYADELIEWVNW